MIDEIMDGDSIIAIIIRRSYESEGITFFTPKEFSQQLAYMKRSSGYKIDPHIHHRVNRNVKSTQEVLFIKKGKVKVDFFGEHRQFLTSQIIEKGDVIMLASGGHGFEMLEDSEILEVKQGPYAGDDDKERFEPKR